MWPMKPKKDMQSNGSAMLIQHKMTKLSRKSNIVPQEDHKNCRENINRRPMKSKMYVDKKCQADKNCQIINMWPVKSQIDVWLKKPGMKSSNKKLIGSAKDRNCQAIICEYNDSKGQSARNSDKN